MRLRLAAILIIAGLCLGGTVSTHAALVQWNIDPQASFVQLNVPDQPIVIDGTSNISRFRNANNAAWTTNVAQLSGQLNSQYVDGSSVQFLSNPTGQFVGLNSGSYRPNPAAFNPAVTDADNPHGTFSNTSTAPGVFGFRQNIQNPILGITVTVGFSNIYDVSFDLESDSLPLNGSGEFAANSSDFGIASATIATDGVISLAGQFYPDSIGALAPLGGLNSALLGSITSPDLINQPDLRRLEIPISVPVQWLFEGNLYDASFSGTIVAYATIPEPSSYVLAGMALVAALATASKRAARPRVAPMKERCVSSSSLK